MIFMDSDEKTKKNSDEEQKKKELLWLPLSLPGPKRDDAGDWFSLFLPLLIFYTNVF